MTNYEERRLKVIEEEDLPDMRRVKERLVKEFAEHKTELKELRQQEHANVIDSGTTTNYYLYL